MDIIRGRRICGSLAGRLLHFVDLLLSPLILLEVLARSIAQRISHHFKITG
jgi:hypothetical protein